MDSEPLNTKGQILTFANGKSDFWFKRDGIAEKKHIIGCRKIDRRERIKPQILKKKKAIKSEIDDQRKYVE